MRSFKKRVQNASPVSEDLPMPVDAAAARATFELDLNTCTVRRSDGRSLSLFREEAALLAYMLDHPHRPFSSDELIQVLEPISEGCTLPRVHSNIYRLRQNLIMFDGRLQVLPARRMSYHYSGPEIRRVTVSLLPQA